MSGACSLRFILPLILKGRETRKALIDMAQIARKPVRKSVVPEIGYLADHREAVPVVAKWIFDEWSFLYPGKNPKVVETFLLERLHKRKVPLTLVAYYLGKPAGTVSLKEFEIETRKDLSPWVASLYVVPELRGRGIGAGLMKSVEEKAARIGIRKLYLFTADSGLAARFYIKRGWKIKEKITYGSYPIILMEKKIV